MLRATRGHVVEAHRSLVGLSPLVRLVLGGAVSALFLYLALRSVAFAELAAVLRRADAGLVCLALGSVAANMAAKVQRWKVLLGPARRSVTYMQLARALLIGQTLNLVLPLRLGDASRVYAVGKTGPGSAFILGTLVIEKTLDMLVYALLVGLSILLLPLPRWAESPAHPVGVAALLAGAMAILLIFRHGWSRTILARVLDRLPRSIGGRLHRLLRSGLASLDVFASHADRSWLAVWTVVIWATAVLNNHLIVLALDLRLPLSASLLLLIVLQAGITIPSMPGGIGVFEYLCILSLAVFGVSHSVALGYGILLHAIVMLPPISASLVLLWAFKPREGSADRPRSPE
jgi:glycosyltransferase 2 family protein